MTFKEAAKRIQVHAMIHHRKEPHAMYISEALDMAVRVLLWMNEQPEWILDENVEDAIEDARRDGMYEGYRQAMHGLKEMGEEEQYG